MSPRSTQKNKGHENKKERKDRLFIPTRLFPVFGGSLASRGKMGGRMSLAPNARTKSQRSLSWPLFASFFFLTGHLAKTNNRTGKVPFFPCRLGATQPRSSFIPLIVRLCVSFFRPMPECARGNRVLARQYEIFKKEETGAKGKPTVVVRLHAREITVRRRVQSITKGNRARPQPHTHSQRKRTQPPFFSQKNPEKRAGLFCGTVTGFFDSETNGKITKETERERDLCSSLGT